MKTEWTLKAGGNALSFRAEGGTLIMTSLRGEQEWFGAESAVPMPDKCSIGEAVCADGWKLVSADESETGLVFSLENGAGLKRTYGVTACGDGVFVISGEISNNAQESATVWLDDTFSAKLPASFTPTLLNVKKESGQAEGLPGGNFSGSGIYTTELSAGSYVNTAFSVHNSWNENGYIPIVYIDREGKSGMLLAVEWPQGRIIAENDGSGAVVATKMDTKNRFSTTLRPGQSMTVPSIYLGAYSGDFDDGSNLFKRWFFNNKAPEKLRNNELEPYTQLDDQGMLCHSDLLAGGVQSLKWDYGWWTDDPPVKEGWMRNLEGDWRLRNSSYIGLINAYGCSTAGEYGQYLNSRGYNFTVYFTLHDSESETPGALTSVGPDGHPEWFSDRVITIGRSADLGNEECVEFVKKTLLERMNEFSCQTWRSDFEPICYSSDKENRHGANGRDVVYWCAVGFYDVVDYLCENKADFRYECCGSGGSLKDYATMSRAIVINNDDSANYNSLRMSFYDTSYCLPPAQIMLPCNPDTFCEESQYYTGTADKDFGMRSILLGVPSMGSWTGPEDGHWRWGMDEYLFKYYKMYNEKIKPLVRNAELYHILPRPDCVNWDGVEYFDPDTGSGAVFLFKPTDAEGQEKTICLRGLDAGASYSLVFEDRPEQNKTLTGAELAAGIAVTIAEDMGSEIIWITRN